jgi:hypothetical protein
MELIQKRYTDRRYFKLEDDGVYFKIKTPTEEVSGKFKYEELGLSTLTVRKKEASWIFIMFALIGMFALRPLIEETKDKPLVDIIFMTICCVLIFGSFFYLIMETKKELVSITDGAKSFSLHRSVPSKIEVDNFIEVLQDRIRERIIKLNVRPEDNKMDTEYKLYQLQSLLDSNIINEQKFKEVEAQIKKSSKKKNIGFTKEEE